MEYFITRLENLLAEKKDTKTALAETIGIRRPTISEWKKNGAIPSGDVCVKIARYFGVRVEWLITGEGEKYERKADSAETRQAEKKEAEAVLDFIPLQRQAVSSAGLQD